MGLLSEGPCAESFSHDITPLVELSPQVHGALGASAFPLKVPVARAAGIGTDHHKSTGTVLLALRLFH